MKRGLYILWLFIQSAQGQVLFDKTVHDFGIIDENSSRIAEFTLFNSTEKTAYILRTGTDEELSIKYSSKKMEPDSIAIIRVQYNPKQTGGFKKTIPVYVSSQPQSVEITLKGIAGFIPYDSPLCPDFSSKDISQKLNFELVVKVVDATSGEPLQNAQVKIMSSPLSYKNLKTDKKGTINLKTTIGHYSIIVNAESHQTEQTSGFFNQRNSTATFQLQSLPHIILQEEKEAVTETQPEDTSKSPVTELPRHLYAPNNVVFLVDVSSSMKKRERIDLLKTAVLEMLQLLRDIDRVAIVTYATDVHVVLPSTAASDKEKISEIIQSLVAEGFTAGGKGILKAYEVAENNYIEEGNNQIIIATDGDWDMEQDKELIPTIKKHAKRGITLSVVGIKNGSITYESLKMLAAKGNGHYIKIKNKEEAKAVLVHEIKMNSKRE
ncbi:MAG: hypothetical protein COA57_10740 [Flavobacteriales bacterium]|nr:MAG: hypothetical protein COA57_10740 [Flavobacteriales bacterium]